MSDALSCDHPSIGVRVSVTHLSAVNGGLPNGQIGVELAAMCSDCGKPFRFVGLPVKETAAVDGTSFDGLRAMLTAEPALVVLARADLTDVRVVGNG